MGLFSGGNHSDAWHALDQKAHAARLKEADNLRHDKNSDAERYRREAEEAERERDRLSH